MKLITHVDPSQLRLGYLSCLALVAGRQLDTRQGLVDRLTRFLFQMIDTKDPRWQLFMERADPNQIDRLKPPEDEKTIALHELFRMAKPDTVAYPLHILWLAQRQLPSHLGLVSLKNVEHILEMGRSFEIITAGFALTEKGVFLQNFLRSARPGIETGNPDTNPFDVKSRLALSLFFLYTLLSVDVLTPFLIHEFANCPHGDLPNSPKLLQHAAMGLVGRVEHSTDITNLDALRQARTYFERLQGKGVAKNQAQPRYHHLFEILLLDRVERDIDGRRIVPYLPTDACRRAAHLLSPLREQPDEYQNLLDQWFFRWAAEIFARPARPSDNERRRLLYFARGYEYLQREIGFTPGRTVALAGCLLALEDGWIVEIAEMFDLLRQMAAGPWRPYLEYSGGSRLDQEFLIKIKPGLTAALQDQLG
jgi:hypothetical protein